MAETSDYSQVVELLRAESEAIAKAASRLLAEEVDRVVAILTRCKGKIILLGVGKSGIIAHKIAATMTSSGTAGLSASIRRLAWRPWDRERGRRGLDVEQQRRD